MPMNIPILTEMKIEHFFLANIHYIQLSLVIFYEVTKLDNWSKIHECSCVACVIFTVLQMNTFVSTAHQTFVFQIINHKRCIMHDLSQCKSPKNILVWVLIDWVTILELRFDRRNEIPTISLGEHHTHDRSPSFASAIQKVINQVSNTPINTSQVAANVW